jgi:Asp-tRNA(Asn)/Glu-tRNA(Gln) amidotransferase A subunit family amidase
VRRLVDAGCIVRDANVPVEFDALSELQDVVMAYDLDKVFEEQIRDHRDKMHPDLIAYCNKGKAVTQAQYHAALDHAKRCRGLLPAAMDGFDVLLIPATLTEAPPITTTGTSEFIRIWTFLHTPAIALPVGRSTNGLPIGVQLVGRLNDDRRFLASAARIDQILGRAD